ncbi:MULTISPECIES: FeoA family protein [Kordiimonas]|jgi:ferrous iron transport protein A|uniref:Ferrous iron transport protein A n=1 Tax=Kordiimonas lacus TaxID=637679 RepID=A0A1G7B951_9PROT|nr:MULTISPECIES: FeoA family protein [Kordiimonas]SDE23561.1 ferrous iron transport protein A [Kordiimonas lacus]
MNQEQKIEGEATGAADALVALGTMKPGMFGHVIAFDTTDIPDIDPDTADRLREMGFAEDLEVEVLHQSLIGRDPIAVRIGRMTVALRRREANIVKVQLV